jgi:hypothetical protein
VADVVRTCTNCGNAQATGDFCERCGNRLPSAAAPAAVPAATNAAAADVPPAAQSATYQVPPPQGAYQAGAYQSGAYPPGTPPPYGYAAQAQYASPKEPSPWGKLFDLSFQGFVTRGSLKVLYIFTMVVLGLYWLFSLIFSAIAADRIGGFWCIGIFSSLFITALMLVWTRVMLELVTTVEKIRDDSGKAAGAKSSETES